MHGTKVSTWKSQQKLTLKATPMIQVTNKITFILDNKMINGGNSDSEDDDDGGSSDEEDYKPAPSTEVVIMIRNRKTQKDELFRVLLDSGTNRCMGTQAAVQRAGLHIAAGHKHDYGTAAGTFTTTCYTRI